MLSRCSYICQSVTGLFIWGMSMHSIKEIHFICFEDEEGKVISKAEHESRWAKVFGKIESILDDFDILPQVTNITRDGKEMIVKVERKFTFDDAIQLLARLEEIYKVTHFDYSTEGEDGKSIEPHLSFELYEK